MPLIFRVLKFCVLIEGLKLKMYHISILLQSKEKEKAFLLGTFKTVTESIVYLASGYIAVTHKVVGSPWLLQLLISDCEESVTFILDLIHKVIRANL